MFEKARVAFFLPLSYLHPPPPPPPPRRQTELLPLVRRIGAGGAGVAKLETGDATGAIGAGERGGVAGGHYIGRTLFISPQKEGGKLLSVPFLPSVLDLRHPSSSSPLGQSCQKTQSMNYVCFP